VSEGTPNPDRAFTLAELSKYNGTIDPTGPIYLGAGGKVFDVTAGAGFYGPGQQAHDIASTTFECDLLSKSRSVGSTRRLGVDLVIGC
jgi:predicted heme/steroid binding protein